MNYCLNMVNHSFHTASQIIGHSYQTTSLWVNGVGNEIANRANQTRVYVITTSSQLITQFSQGCINLANRIENYVYQSRHEIFFTVCCATAAYFAPILFFASAGTTFILRIEMTRKLKELCDYYLQDLRNPFKIDPRCNPNVTTSEIALGVVGSADALALGTIYTTNSYLVGAVPALCGVAAGNYAAKLWMNATNFLN